MKLRMVSAREIVGKRITGFTYQTFPQGANGGGVLHIDVTLTLDDGSFLYFITEESDGGDEYGMFVGRSMPRKGNN
jgi:hypothetical protein